MMARTIAIAACLVTLSSHMAYAQAAPEPPRRPADLGSSSLRDPSPAQMSPPSASAGGPVRLQTDVTAPPASRPMPPPPGSPVAASAGPLTDDAAVDRVNTYMNSFRTLIADFVQFGADGRKYEGKLYIQRPGKMRFEYRPPATIEVISDGTTVVVRDKRLATQDPYLIGQTPLKFLLKDQIDLRRDVKITRVSATPDLIRITLEDKATLGGTSRITLHFDPKNNNLKQWVILDPQGYETSVQVANLDTGRRPDPALFTINLERILENRN